jgi:hypothetical protein
MHRAGAEWPSARIPVTRRLRAASADLISVAGSSRGLHQTPLEAPGAQQSHSPIVLLGTAAWVVPRPRNSSVPSSRPKQSGGSSPQASPVSRGLGGGAASGAPDDGAPGGVSGRGIPSIRRAQGQSSRGLRRSTPQTACASLRLLPIGRPVRRQASPLPSGGTRSQSAGEQPRGAV